jgi:glycosyltransferase involved in cell wall biosynthesis
VLLACAGLDHARRGFESFARECFEALRDEDGIELELVKGSGPAGDGERAVRTLRRDHAVARAAGRLTGGRPFRFEHAAFGLSLQRELRRRDPDVVYLSEWDTARVLAALRRPLWQRFRLVLCNGTPATANFGHLDVVQQLTPVALEASLARGADPARQVLLPLGFAIPPRFDPPTAAEKQALRRSFDLPPDRHIVLSVAALNRSEKRLDHLIEEIARLEGTRPFLLLLGEVEQETPGIRALASGRLGEDGHGIRTVSRADVEALLRAADTFVLASLGEVLPRALIEAHAAGLPCVAHDYAVTRFALGEHGRFADMTKTGALAEVLRRVDEPGAAAARHRDAYERFSWERLKPRYVEMLRTAAGRAARPA